MAIRTLSELRSAVRDQLQCSTTELPDGTIDRWLDQASAHIHSYTDWNWLDTTWELSTASIYTDYSQIVDADGYVPKHPRNILIGDNRLEWISEEELRHAIGLWGASESEPTHWSTRAGRTLILAPQPDQAYSLTITGFRARKDWTSDGVAANTPDMPDDFDSLLEFYALFRGYMRKRDPETAMTHWGMYVQQMELLDRDLNAAHHGNKPIIMNRGQWNKDRSSRTASGIWSSRGRGRGPIVVYTS